MLKAKATLPLYGVGDLCHPRIAGETDLCHPSIVGETDLYHSSIAGLVMSQGLRAKPCVLNWGHWKKATTKRAAGMTTAWNMARNEAPLRRQAKERRKKAQNI